MNWKDKIQIKNLSLLSEKIIDNLIYELNRKNIYLFKNNNLDQFDIGLIYRWPIYITTNIFIERIFRAKYSQEIEFKKISKNYIFEYQLNTHDVTTNLYYNINLNENLIYLIYKILNSNEIESEKHIIFTKKTKKITVLKNIKNKIRRLINISKNKKYDDGYFFDNYLHLNHFLSSKNKLIEMPYENHKINYAIREEIFNIAKEVFFKLSNKLEIKLDKNKKDLLSNLYANLINYSLPISLIESLNKKINYYQKILNVNHIKNIHSSVGYYYNDNLKIISFLAKKKNPRINLIWHEHGSNNFIQYISNDSQKPNFNKGNTPMHYLDYFLYWGKDKLGDTFDNIEQKLNIKVINVGNVYLQSLKNTWKRNKNIKENNNIKLLYSSSPARKYMTNLEEISPEESLRHQINIFNFLYELLGKYQNLQIIYKPFTPKLNQDLDKYIKNKIYHNKNFIVEKDKAVNLMQKVDIVLFDTISTGFSEAINIGVPALIFNNKFDYNNASKEGKNINNLLEQNNIVFYNKDIGLKSIELIINNFKYFTKKSNDAIELYKNYAAYPINKNEFIDKLRKNKLI